MYWYLVLTLLWGLGLLLLRPKPESLRTEPIPYWENFVAAKATFGLGLTCIAVYALVASVQTIPLDAILALNNQMSFSILTVLQFFTNIFVHFGIIHLLSNLSILGILSIYEKRVGSTRFLKIFFVSALVANLSILLHFEPVLSAGASGGIAGLAAAYFLDHRNVTTKQYLVGFISALLVFGIFQIQTFIEAQDMNANVDFLGHILGFVAGAVMVRLLPTEASSEDLIKNN